MHTEIERKFLVIGEFKQHAYQHSHIEQGYFATDPGRTVRIRIRDDKAYLTIKGPSTNAGLSRYEFETEIPVDDAKMMMTMCMSGQIIKDRYLVRSGKHVVEVDEFYGDNKGLVLAEIELNREDEAYEKPEFLGREVTGDVRFYNKYLSKHPYNSWNDTDKKL
jgi:CYTH domain-containing protein